MIKKQLNKEKANANVYYNLFADKIGKFNNNENILLIHIGNFDVISKFIVNNVNCNYFIIDKHLNGDYLKLNFPQIHFIGADEDESIIKVLEQINMKFDKIIMNPPFGRGLHLKILSEARKHLTKNGIFINLSPIKEFQKALLINGNPPLENVKILDYISDKEASKIFNIGMNNDIGIMSNIGNDCIFVENLVLDRKLFEKCNELIKCNGFLKDHFDKNISTEFIIKFGQGAVNHSGSKKCWYTITNLKQETAFKLSESGNTKYYNAKNKEEQINVHSFYTRDLIRFICKDFGFGSQPYYMMPWMGECINPRTGLKGYESEWTDEDLFNYFNITKEEQELIEKTMEKYK